MGFWNLWHCHGGICPVLKTAAMTQPVGVGQDGKLWTEPTGGSGSDVKVVKCVPSVVSSSIFFSVPAGYKIMTIDLVFVNGGTYKTLALTRIDDNVELQNVNFIDKISGTTATLAENVSTGGCVLDDAFSLTSYTGVYGVAVCVPN